MLNTADNSLAMPTANMTVLQTTVYLSHDLDVFYGQCDDSEPPDSEIECPPNKTRTLKNKVIVLKCRYCNKMGIQLLIVINSLNEIT